MQEKQELDCKSAVDANAVFSRDMAVCMDKFARSFEASARRWELVVYPSLLAFIVLASYGFYLIYTLTNDVARLASSMETVVVSMDDVASNMTVISGDLTAIAADVGDQAVTMKNMVKTMGDINQTMAVMSVPVYQMRHDMASMSHNIHNVAGPMKVISGILP